MLDTDQLEAEAQAGKVQNEIFKQKMDLIRNIDDMTISQIMQRVEKVDQLPEGDSSIDSDSQEDESSASGLTSSSEDDDSGSSSEDGLELAEDDEVRHALVAAGDALSNAYNAVGKRHLS